MMKTNQKILIVIGVLAVIGIILINGCVKEKPIPTQQPSTLKTEPIDLSNIQTEKISFTKYYSLDPLNVKLQTAQYNLPLKTNEISNFNKFESRIKLSNEARKELQDKGFAIIENPFNPKEEDITDPYKTLKDKEIPIFITSDSLLHLYHIQFDETLRQIEEREFYDKIWDISKTLYDYSIKQYNNSDGDLKEAAKRNVAYFAAGLELLKPKKEQICKKEKYGICYISDYETTDELFMKEEAKKYIFEVPDFVKKDVDKELKLIEKHEGFSTSPIFIYGEDYSQYVPRGHYTCSEKLKNYFKAFMWYGRISMLLKGDPGIPPGETCQDCKAFISTYDANIQTIQACLIASEFARNKELKDKWDRIYSVTAFYVGFSDDLGPYEYLEAMNAVFGDRFNVKDLTEENIDKLKAKLAEYRTPEIYGGTGQQFVSSAGGPDEVLANTQGFRLMGQRFIPDSYIFQNLVYGYVTEYLGDKEPFTMVFIDGVGPARGFPRGLDVMSLLGSKRAMEILEEGDDTNYKNYSTQYAKLREEFDNFTVKDWNKNLYWSWLYALKPLLKEFGKGYPTFMQTKAWQDKELTTALASWAELRHDTILYAKQSYTMAGTAAPITPPEKPVVGYVEPVPEFYNRLLALTRMTNKGLDEMDVLDDKAKYGLQNLERILERLVNISKKELENEELTRDDYDFIKNFGEELNSIIGDVDDKAKKTTIIADVHTDINTKKVLEEGVGYVKLIVVAYKIPDGRILVGAGPVFSYYEFKHPMKDRLTDEKWREMLRLNPPNEMEWVRGIEE